MPNFIMTVGIPGSGKSTFVSHNKKDMIVVSTDKIREYLFGNISDQSNNHIVFARAIGRLEGVLLAGESVIFDATNTEFCKWSEMIETLPKCRKIAWVFNVKPEIAYSRIKKDISIGINRSNVPEDAIYKHYGNFLYTLKKLPKYFDEVIDF